MYHLWVTYSIPNLSKNVSHTRHFVHLYPPRPYPIFIVPGYRSTRMWRGRVMRWFGRTLAAECSRVINMAATSRRYSHCRCYLWLIVLILFPPSHARKNIVWVEWTELRSFGIAYTYFAYVGRRCTSSAAGTVSIRPLLDGALRQ